MISQTTDFVRLDKLLKSYEETNFNNSMYSSVYYGIDCTNDFIHEGTLFQLLLLRRFLSHKFNVILVLGGGTTLVGDPSYKLRKSRNQDLYYSDFILKGKNKDFDTSNEEAIYSIATKILSLPLKIDDCFVNPQVNRLTDLGDSNMFTQMCTPYNVFVLNNRDLYRRVNLMEYLEAVARNMNVGRMLSRDCIKMRMVDKDNPEFKKKSVNMDLSELMYMSLQAMDFIYLAQNFNCKIQLGGNDQMGNIISGIELADSLGVKNVFGITTPLVKDKFGEKISKTGSNCFLKITQQTTPHELWSHFRSIDDSNLENYIKWFTEISLDKTKEAMDDHYNTAKVLLADELTGLLYGNQMVELIHKFCLSKQFEDLTPYYQDGTTSLKEFESFVNFTKAVPHIRLDISELEKGVELSEVLDRVRIPQLSKATFHSNKKFIREGGCKINGRVTTDTRYKLTRSDLVKLSSEGNVHLYITIQLGNRKIYFVIVDDTLSI